MPYHAGLGIGTFVDALITRIALSIHFLLMQQAVAFEHIVKITQCDPKRVHQNSVNVSANVGHAKVPLVALWAGVHLRVAGFVVVLTGAGSRNERVADHGAGLEQ